MTHRAWALSALAAIAATWAPGNALASFEREPLAPANIAIGRSGVADTRARVSGALNPASSSGTWVDAAYCRPFGVAGLSEQSVGGVLPVGSTATLSSRWDRFGNDLYVEDTASLGGAYRIGAVSAGVRGSSYSHRVADHDRRGAWSADVGLQARVQPTIGLGGSVRRVRTTRGTPPREYRIGTEMRIDDASTVFADLYRRRDESGVAVGVEWRGADWLTLAGGVHSHPWQWATGFTLRRDGFLLVYAVETHSALSATHSVSIAIGAQP